MEYGNRFPSGDTLLVCLLCHKKTQFPVLGSRKHIDDSNIDWTVAAAANVDTQVNIMDDIIVKLCDVHAPVRFIRRPDHVSWKIPIRLRGISVTRQYGTLYTDLFY